MKSRKDYLYQDIGRYLTAARGKMGLSEAEQAERAEKEPDKAPGLRNTTLPYIQAVERGVINPLSPEHLRFLAKLYEVDPLMLFRSLPKIQEHYVVLSLGDYHVEEFPDPVDEVSGRQGVLVGTDPLGQVQTRGPTILDRLVRQERRDCRFDRIARIIKPIAPWQDSSHPRFRERLGNQHRSQ